MSQPNPSNGYSQEPSGQSIAKNLNVSAAELNEFLKFHPDYERRSELVIFFIGVFLTPVTLAGALLGFIRAYKRFDKQRGTLPRFYPMTPLNRAAMIIGAAFMWLVVIIIIVMVYPTLWLSQSTNGFLLLFLLSNFIVSTMVFGAYKLWRIRINNALIEGEKFGSARFARDEELLKFKKPGGIYIGGLCFYKDNGHLLTVAGTRSGKFTNLIAPNMLGLGDIDGSWVIIDPKGEIASVTGAYQRKSGQNVVILNPWGLLTEHVGAAQTYNPLDILDVTSPHLVDDCQMLAEMLVPVETGRNKFFSDSARSIITGLILYIATVKEDQERSLTTLWKITRYPQAEFDRVLAEMENSDDELNGENLLFAASEITKITLSGSTTWGSVLATVLQATEFLKSPSMQKALQSGFDPKTLAHSQSVVYVIIPADKLQSHSRWLRLVTTSTMRAVIRNPNKRVVFLLDEFAALGYLPEIEIALGTYAGFNVTIWPVLQSLVQLQNLYKDNWQIFIGSAAVRHFFGIHNNFDADYISRAIGMSSHVITTTFGSGKVDSNATPRPLITPDELRIGSGKNIFTFIDDLPVTYFEKVPYYEVEVLNENAEENPYIKL